jgi:hypothetical protein
MPCLLALLAVAFPRIAIVLLYLFTNFFVGVYHTLLIPILGFIFLPLTLIVYTYLLNSHTPILDLGLLGPSIRNRFD